MRALCLFLVACSGMIPEPPPTQKRSVLIKVELPDQRYNWTTDATMWVQGQTLFVATEYAGRKMVFRVPVADVREVLR